MKTIDYKTVKQYRDSLIEEIKGLSTPLENFDVQHAILNGQIQCLTYILQDGIFDCIKFKINK